MTPKTKKLGVLGADKRGKTLKGHELGKDLMNEEVGGNIFYGEDAVLVEDGCTIYKRGKVFYRYDLQIIDMFLQILRFPTNIRGLICRGYVRAFSSRHPL